MKPEKSDSCTPMIIETIAHIIINNEKMALKIRPIFSKAEIT